MGWYGFLHLTLQEYFAATALLERGQEGIDLLLRKRFDPWWEEVILLFAGATPDAGPLLRGMRSGEDDIFHSDLFLAARCLSGVPRISDPSLRDEILTAVREIAFSAKNKSESRRAVRVLAEAAGWPRTERDVAQVFADDVPGPNQIAIVAALAETRRPEVAEWFLTRIESTKDALPNSLGDDIWSALADALARMRRQPAYERLRALYGALSGRVGRQETVLAAAVRIPGRAGPLLRDLRSDSLQIPSTKREIYAWAIASTTLTPARADELLDLALLQDGWFFGLGQLAHAYIAATGTSGVKRLLDDLFQERDFGLPRRPSWSGPLLPRPRPACLVPLTPFTASRRVA